MCLCVRDEFRQLKLQVFIKPDVLTGWLMYSRIQVCVIQYGYVMRVMHGVMKIINMGGEDGGRR